MREVLHLTTATERIAGAERLLIDIGRFVDRTEWSLAFVTLRSRGPVSEELEATGWPVFSLRIEEDWMLPLGAARLLALLQQRRPAVLHAHLFHGAVLGAFVRRFMAAKLVQTRHYSDYVTQFGSRARQTLDHWAARRADAVIAVSDAARDQLVRDEGVSPLRVSTVENGVDWVRLASLEYDAGRHELRSLGVPDGRIVGCCASFRAQKGHRYLLEACSTLRTTFPDLQVVLLGVGPDEGDLRDRTRSLGLTDSVHFLGHREDALNLMSGFDVYVQPSVEEGFGLAVVEAMAMGRPVVVSDVGGMTKTVEHGRSGLRVEPANPEALADALAALLLDPVRARTLGQAARERIRKRYNIARTLSGYDEVYKTVLGDRGANVNASKP
jgi:glycosyltransferase involved in cell wall biosynthesis